MDITYLYTSSWELICDSLTHSLTPAVHVTSDVITYHVVRGRPLDTDLRYYVIRDCYLNTVVSLVDTDLRYYVIRDVIVI